MRVRSCSSTHVGKVRKNNEDNYLTLDQYGLWAVADGMGGHAAGEVASKIAIDTLRSFVEPFVGFDAAFAAAHANVIGQGAENAYGGMGTTLTACVLRGHMLDVAHAGDSALYLLHDQQVKKITTDQSNGHVLLNCIGGNQNMFKGAEHATLSLEPGDIIVLATDGLTNYLDETGLAIINGARRGFAGLAGYLISFALEEGGKDNVTVVCVECK